MAYVVISAKDGRELARCPLDGPLSIGRDPANHVRVHDILLSWNHCRIEPEGKRWIIIDLGSRNGTFVNFARTARHKLLDGDRVLIGRTAITFHVREFAAAETERLAHVASIDSLGQESQSDRPVDPFEALSGTVADFKFESDSSASIKRPKSRTFPVPRPVAASGSLTLSKEEQEGENLAFSSSPTWATKKIASATTRLRTELDRCFESAINPAPKPQKAAIDVTGQARPPEHQTRFRTSWAIIVARILIAATLAVLAVVGFLRFAKL